MYTSMPSCFRDDFLDFLSISMRHHLPTPTFHARWNIISWRLPLTCPCYSFISDQLYLNICVSLDLIKKMLNVSKKEKNYMIHTNIVHKI